MRYCAGSGSRALNDDANKEGERWADAMGKKNIGNRAR
jgi:hypothetical protein